MIIQRELIASPRARVSMRRRRRLSAGIGVESRGQEGMQRSMQSELITKEAGLLVRRLTLAAEESTPWHTDVCRRFTVVAQGEQLRIEYGDTGEQLTVDVHPGMADWDQPNPRVHRAINVGSRRLQAHVGERGTSTKRSGGEHDYRSRRRGSLIEAPSSANGIPAIGTAGQPRWVRPASGKCSDAPAGPSRAAAVDHAQLAAAFRADLDVDREHPFQALHPRHGGGELGLQSRRAWC
jgi:hypothetical protein